MDTKNKIEVIITNTIKIIFIIIILHLLIISISFSCSVDINEITSYDTDSIIKNMIFIMISVLLCFGIAVLKTKSKKVNEKNIISKKYVYIIGIVCIAFSLIWIISTQLGPRADQFYVLNASRNIANGNFEDFEKGRIHVYLSCTIRNSTIYVFYWKYYR